MSDMIINDTVPVDKKWNELIRYNIFIMKLVEFVISLIIMILPTFASTPHGHMYCIATSPTLVISLLLMVLYVRDKVPLFMEKLYLFLQMAFVLGAFVQCFILNLVHVWIWLIYCPVFLSLLVVLSLDLFLVATERGCVFSIA